MFSSVHYINSQEGFEQDSLWLAKELERRNQESAEANDSDTLSCSDLGCIDDMLELEGEDFNPIINTVNNEHADTDNSGIDDFKIDHAYIRELNEDQVNNVCTNFPYDHKYYRSYKNNPQKDESNLKHVGFIDKVQALYVINNTYGEETGQEDVQICLNEEESGGYSDESYEYSAKKLEECVAMSVTEEERIDDHEETSTCSNELTDDVKSEGCEDAPGNSCGSDDSDVEFADIIDIDEEQTENESSKSHSEDSTKSIKIVVIGKEANFDEEVRLHETETSDHDKKRLNSEDPIDQIRLKPNCKRQEEDTKPQATQTCDILFRDKDKSAEDMFICEHCHKVFSNQYKLDSHRYKNHGSQIELERSRDIVKPKSKPKENDDWPPNIQKLARRMNGKKLFYCNHCSYSVDRCDSITKHIFRIHSNGRPVPQFQCEVCGKMFMDRAYLRNHKVSHSTEKVHSCDVCGRAFHRQPSLKRHLQTHTDDRQFSCTLCDYQTNRKHMMYKHVENHKLGRAYICHICDSHLYTQLAYRSHMYEHRVPANSCSFCKVGFSSKERMMSHMRKAHSAYEINVYKKEPKQEPLD